MGFLKSVAKTALKAGKKAAKSVSKAAAKEAAVIAKDVALPTAKTVLKESAKNIAKDTLKKVVEADKVRRDSSDMTYNELLDALKDKNISEAQRVGYIAAWKKEKHKK